MESWVQIGCRQIVVPFNGEIWRPLGGRDRWMGLWGIVQPPLPLHVMSCGLQSAVLTSRPPINVSSLLTSFTDQKPRRRRKATVSFTACTSCWFRLAIKQKDYTAAAVNHAAKSSYCWKLNCVQKQNPGAVFQNTISPAITQGVLWSTNNTQCQQSLSIPTLNPTQYSTI